MHFPDSVEVRFEDREFSEEIDFSGAQIKAIKLANSRLKGGLRASPANVQEIDLMNVTSSGPISIKAMPLRSVRLTQGTFEGTVEIEVNEAFSLGAPNATFKAPASFVATDIHTWEAMQSRFLGGLRIGRQLSNVCNIQGMRIGGCLDLRGCRILYQLSLDEVEFESHAWVDLSDAVLNSLYMQGRQPDRLILDRAVVRSVSRVCAPMGKPPTPLVATEERPTFHGQVTFANVDLSRCRLVGNPLTYHTFADVLWARWKGRFALYDEIALRRGQWTPLGTMREAYQALKTKYQSLGEHSRAGDFHYGELEMRRHSYGNVGSLFCWEFPYWLFSGYGTRPTWAFGWLCLLTLVGALLYWWLGYADGFLEALRFSIAVTTLQKRDYPGDVGGWVKVIQTVLGVVLIALFVLGVRMRLKR